MVLNQNQRKKKVCQLVPNGEKRSLPKISQIKQKCVDSEALKIVIKLAMGILTVGLGDSTCLYFT
jgi:hypothetical protein